MPNPRRELLLTEQVSHTPPHRHTVEVTTRTITDWPPREATSTVQTQTYPDWPTALQSLHAA